MKLVDLLARSRVPAFDGVGVAARTASKPSGPALARSSPEPSRRRPQGRRPQAASRAEGVSRGVQRLLSRVAQTINAIARRSGSLWRDRYHREDLTTPSQVRNAYVYVLFNDRRHALHRAYLTEQELTEVDACSSAAWFSGWAPGAAPDEDAIAGAGPPIVARAETWLARVGWCRKRGPLRVWEVPRTRA
jgi:hypothetical protein